jgi:hypothetical protein
MTARPLAIVAVAVVANAWRQNRRLRLARERFDRMRADAERAAVDAPEGASEPVLPTVPLSTNGRR